MRRLLSLRLENIGAHAALDLDLSNVDAGAIVGPNGAGKTTIFRAIRWALYGDTDADALMRDGSQHSRVTLQVEQAGSRWRIIRARQRGKSSTLTLERRESDAWVSLTQRTIAETQQRIEAHVTGMTADQHFATMYAAQSQCGYLAALRPGDRKDLLGQLLGLARWERWRNTAAAHHRGLQTQLAVHDTNAEQLRHQATDLAAVMPDPVDLANELAAAEARVQQAARDVDHALEAQEVRVLVARRDGLRAQMNELRGRKQRALDTQARRAELASILAGSDDVRARFEVLEQERRTHEAAVASHAERARAALRAAEEADERVFRAERAAEDAAGATRRRELTLRAARGDRDRLNAVEDSTCPVCEQALRDEARAKAIAALDQRVALAERDLADARTLEAAADAEVAMAREALVQLPSPPAAPDTNGYDPQAYDAARAAVTHLDRLTGEHNSLGEPEDIETLRAEYEQIRAEWSELPRDAPEAPAVAEARAELAAAQGALSQVQARVARCDSQREQLAGLEQKIRDLEQARPELAADVETWATLTRACSREGAPALILDNAVGDVEAHANETLERLGSPLRVALETQRQTKSGTVSETLAITVSDGAGFHPLARYGGGQQYRVHLALRVGLARTIAGRGGPACEVLLIDEITDLDDEGVTSLGPLLASWPWQVLLVSHDQRLSAALPTRIQITPSPGRAPSSVHVTS